MHLDVIRHLRCPVCAGPLSRAERSLRCPAGHSFDLARQGYVDLTAGRVTHAGDSSEMIAAREALLSAGHFGVVSDAVTRVVGAEHRRYRIRMLLEVGAGTGHYLARALGPDQVGLAVDVSKPALRRAARVDPRIGAVRADVWQGLPVRDGTADVVLDVFAPRSGAEFARVLRPGGALVVVTAVPGHLDELIGRLGLIGVDPAKEERLAASLDGWFRQESASRLTAPLRLSRPDAAALVGMGPSARHVDAAQIYPMLAAMPEPIEATLAVTLTVWRPV